MENLNLIFPEIFISLSIMFLLILGVFMKDGSKLTFCGYSRSYNSQNEDIWIFQINSDGNDEYIFNKTIGGALVDKSYSIRNTSDGGFIIAGNTSSISIGGDLQAVLIKTDPQGNTANFE